MLEHLDGLSHRHPRDDKVCQRAVGFAVLRKRYLVEHAIQDVYVGLTEEPLEMAHHRCLVYGVALAVAIQPQRKRLPLLAAFLPQFVHCVNARLMRERERGIDPVHMEEIFKAGYTTKSDHAGLGLHEAVNAMREMEGDLAVRSKGSDKGTTVTLIMPEDCNKTGDNAK